jgi:hypothetical protein
LLSLGVDFLLAAVTIFSLVAMGLGWLALVAAVVVAFLPLLRDR